MIHGNWRLNAGMMALALFVASLAVGAEGGKPADDKSAANLKDVLPLTEAGTYEKDGKKFERGLYPDGKNEIPQAHLDAGVLIAKTIAPIDGEIVASSIGHSNPRAYFTKFEFLLRTQIKEGKLNPKFVLKNH